MLYLVVLMVSQRQYIRAERPTRPALPSRVFFSCFLSFVFLCTPFSFYFFFFFFISLVPGSSLSSRRRPPLLSFHSFLSGFFLFVCVIADPSSLFLVRLAWVLSLYFYFSCVFVCFFFFFFFFFLFLVCFGFGVVFYFFMWVYFSLWRTS